MNKLFAVLFAASLCACATTKPVVVVQTPVVKEPSPLTLEVAGLHHISALRCTDELQCIQKLTGLCSNGYNNAEMLRGTNQAVVGVAFNCITDEEKVAQAARLAQRLAEEKEWQAERAARIAAAKAEAAKAATTPVKKK